MKDGTKIEVYVHLAPFKGSQSRLDKAHTWKAAVMSELIIQGWDAGMLPEGKRVDAKRSGDGIKVTIVVKGSAASSIQAIDQTWEVHLTPQLANELQGKLGNALGGKDKTI